MLILNALTNVQVALFSALAALAAPGEQPVDQTGQVTEADASEQNGEFTAETDETARKRWRCYDDDEYKKRGYCLSRCEDDWGYTPVSDKVGIQGSWDWCKHRARKYCKRRHERVEDWCFGDKREWDDDNHDDDDDDDHDNDDNDH